VGTVNCEYQRRGLIIFFTVQAVITTNGTGAGQIKVSLPFQARTFGGSSYLNGKGVGLVDLTGMIQGGTSYCYITKYDGTYPGADGAVVSVSGVYAR